MSNLGIGIILSGKDLQTQNDLLKKIGDYIVTNVIKDPSDEIRKPVSKQEDTINCYYAINGDVDSKIDMMGVYKGMDNAPTLWFDKVYDVSYLEKRLIQFMKENSVDKYIIIDEKTIADEAYFTGFLEKFKS